MFISDPDRIRIRPKVSDPYGSGSATLQEKPSALKREHPALQNMKILYFFLFLWVIFALLDPDPVPQFECGSGSGSSN
jgi:hypothetical protein